MIQYNLLMANISLFKIDVKSRYSSGGTFDLRQNRNISSNTSDIVGFKNQETLINPIIAILEIENVYSNNHIDFLFAVKNHIAKKIGIKTDDYTPDKE